MNTRSRIDLLSRLRLSHKLALLAAAMLVPVALLGCFYFLQAAASARQARDELRGDRFLQALASLQADVTTHRGRAYTLLSGDAARRADVLAAQSQVDARIALLDSLETELGRDLDPNEEWARIRSEWSDLKSRTLQQSAEENDAAEAALSTRITALIHAIGIRSRIAFEPDSATRALVQIAAEYTPELLDITANIRRHSVRAAAKGYLGGDDRMGLRIFHDRELAQAAGTLRTLERVTPSLRSALDPALESARSEAGRYFAFVQSQILNASELKIAPGAVYDSGAAAHRAWKALLAISHEALHGALEQRLSELNARRQLGAGVTVAALTLALLMAWLTFRSLAVPLRHSVQVFDRIAAGRYDSAIEVRGTDEGSQVLLALRHMQQEIGARLEAERAEAAENARIRHALDKASTGVILADSSHRILFMNDTALQTLTRAEPEIRKSIPEFTAATLRGSALQNLAVDREAERHRLETLAAPQTQERTLGSLTFLTVSSPVVDENGARLGTVLEWTDRTLELATENDMRAMLSAVVAGDLSRRIPLTDKVDFFAVASRQINQLADNLADIVQRVKDASAEVRRGAQELSAGSTHLQQRTEEQSASLEQTASSMEQMTSTVKQNAENARHANELAAQAREQAQSGGAVVDRAVHAMTDIDACSRRIADIIGVIDEIAFQTNLLALNAAVEAARAGEQGRGFAVVASEVRSLAGRSAAAARQIKELIRDSVGKVASGSLLVGQSGETLRQIVASVKKVSDIVAEIAAASQEQSGGIAQVNRAVAQMDGLTQENAALVEQATSASQSMAREAHALYEMLGSYRVDERGSAGGRPVPSRGHGSAAA